MLSHFHIFIQYDYRVDNFKIASNASNNYLLSKQLLHPVPLFRLLETCGAVLWYHREVTRLRKGAQVPLAYVNKRSDDAQVSFCYCVVGLHCPGQGVL